MARAALDKSWASQPRQRRQIIKESPGGPEPASPAGSTNTDIEIINKAIAAEGTGSRGGSPASWGS